MRVGRVRATLCTIARAFTRAESRASPHIGVARATFSNSKRTTVRGDAERRRLCFSAPRSFASDTEDAGERGAASTSPPDDTSTSSENANARKDLYMMFTCGRCDARAARGFSRQAYEKGVVIVTCPECQVKHVVADRMGWFGEPGSVEDFIAEKARADGGGEDKATRGSIRLTEDGDGTLEINSDELEEWLKRFTPNKGEM